VTSLAGALASPRTLDGQVTATADLALGAVGYAGFLGSAAASFAPGIRFDSPTFSAAALGSYLLYESGRSLIQAAAAAAWLTPSVGPARVEVSAFGGLSHYADVPAGGYGLGRARLHLSSRHRGLWAGAGVGGVYAGSTSATWTTSELATGAWIGFPELALSLIAARSTVADSVYIDIMATVRWLPGPFELDAQLGVRPSSGDSAGPGFFAEATGRLSLTRAIAAQLSAGRYLADPLRGSVAGRYLNAGIRITFAGARSSIRTADERLRTQLRLPQPVPAGAPALQVSEAALGARTLTVRAGGAARLEIAGDFTDWTPVTLERGPGDVWRLTLALPPGVYRLNVRVDGGAWIVPRGATPQEDEFGSRVGLIVVR